jgi:AcrR family transcriptional regulator
MRTRGWQGDQPLTDDEARTRILDAAKRCVERFGPSKTRLADVASELGVTRQTVYRYFPSVNEMLVAVAEAGADAYLDRMAQALSFVTTPNQAVTESIVYSLRSIPTEPSLSLLLRATEADVFTRGAISSPAIHLGANMLRRFSIDWDAEGIDEPALQGLAELVMRLLISFLQYPADPPRTDDEYRTLIGTWLVPDSARPHRRPTARRRDP